MRTIAIINQKGGVGKTTTVANFGAAIAHRGHDVCLIDLDPQSHLTMHLGVEPGSPPSSAYDLLLGNADVASTAITISPHLSLIPSVIDLAAAEVELVATVGREQILRDHLAGQELPYEFVIIDCPPSLGLLTLNTLAAADDVIIPLQPHFLALQGLGRLLETVSLVQRRINEKLRVSGVILCMYETSTRLAAEVLADLQGFFAAARDTDVPWGRTRIFESVIRRNVKLAECPSYGKTIFDYAPHSNGAGDYAALADEFLGTLAAAEGSQGQPGPEVQPSQAAPPQQPVADSPPISSPPTDLTSEEVVEQPGEPADTPAPPPQTQQQP